MRTIKRLEDLTALVEQDGRSLFVRYSRGPVIDRKAGASTNHQTGALLDGLSCNPLNAPIQYRVNGRCPQDYIQMQVRDYSYMLYQGSRGTRAWILAGTEIARGSDNEPLVTDWEPIAWIDTALIKSL